MLQWCTLGHDSLDFWLRAVSAGPGRIGVGAGLVSFTVILGYHLPRLFV
jgi:hypothetical protein